MVDRSDVCVLLPTLEEAETIGDVVAGFRDAGFEHVLVVDGNSTDGTREIAREHGARVMTQSGAGKGQAVREGVATVDREYVLMADGDGTYRPADADRMLEPLFEGRADHVIGDRFAPRTAVQACPWRRPAGRCRRRRPSGRTPGRCARPPPGRPGLSRCQSG